MEAAVARDMASQAAWTRALEPAAALLKFRLPWDRSSSQYLGGTVLLPVWGPATTTEARLHVVPISAGDSGTEKRTFEDVTWDHTEYMEQMCYFNTTTRVTSYGHAVQGCVRGVCSCFDCASEVGMWAHYLRTCGAAWVPIDSPPLHNEGGGHSPVGVDSGLEHSAGTTSAGEVTGARYCSAAMSCPGCLHRAVVRLMAAASSHCSPHGRRHLDTAPLHPAQRATAWYTPKHFDVQQEKMTVLSAVGHLQAR
jgi:hypothetical protein